MRAHYFRGIVYIEIKEYQKAVYDFEKILQIDSTMSEAYLQRGICYSQLGQKENAILDFKQVLLKSNDPDLRQEAENQLDKLGVK